MDVHCLNLNYFQECTNIAVSAGLFGFVIGGFSRSRKAFDLFVAENKHEMFRHPREAQVLIIIESCAKSTYFNNLLRLLNIATLQSVLEQTYLPCVVKWV